MFDKFLRGYNSLLKGFAGLTVFIIFVLLVIASLVGGVLYNLGTGTPFILFPMVVIFVSGWLFLRWRRHRRNVHDESVASEALDSVGHEQLSGSENLRQTILELLNKYERLTTIQLTEKCGASSDAVNDVTRTLLQEKAIIQTISGAEAYFTRAL
jgi:hypothetical protein